MDLQIEGRHIDITPQWRSDIESRVQDLYPGREVPPIRVALAKLEHRKAEDSYDVLIVLQIPGDTITARKHQSSFEEAIRNAFAVMKVELDKIREKREAREIRVAGPPERGVVSKLLRDKGYGFISMENGMEVYFHRNAVHNLSFEEIEDGMEVSLNIEPGDHGPQATTVCAVPPIGQHYADKGSMS
jgi:cold shock CspA family protein/ribosome-associated translation inhibitor RaiA